MAENVDNIEWCDDVTTLEELGDHATFPCVVKVTEGFYSHQDVSTFSCGDLLKIDSLETIEKVKTNFVRLSSCSSTKQSSSEKSQSLDHRRTSRRSVYRSIPGEFSIPLSYRGAVKILPANGVQYVYSNITDVMEDRPRYLHVQEAVSFKGRDSVVNLKHGDILKSLPVTTDQKASPRYLRCLHNLNDIIHIPSTLKGQFQVLPDEDEYSLQEVIDRFPLPQIVQFGETLSREVVSDDILEAFGNLDSFEGKMCLNHVYSEDVLVGHYKALEENQDKSESKFIKRSAFVLPLSNPELSEVSVQYPMYMDSSNYNFFVARNFSHTPKGSEVMDGSLYVEFTKKAQVRFALEGKEKCPPPRPPRKKTKPVATVSAVKRAPQPDPVISMPSIPPPRKEVTKPNTRDDKVQWTIGPLYKNTSTLTSSVKTKADQNRDDDDDDDDDEEVGEYVEIDDLDLKPKSSTTTTGDQKPVKPFSDLTVEELKDVFKLCKLSSLAKICGKEAYDGKMFSVFSKENLRSKPFRLKSTDLIKLDRIKQGWRPSHTK
ncbi:uncharacterized protein LOC126819503 [Patella vulgata]|uniref:uncharacterized protein LOC126819503 n=1 Tax=Patella vulgata TaxID=6465 RepID=UPI00217F2F89|nr:uncharacterized protein LOC126819503 [Patella vulgata]